MIGKRKLKDWLLHRVQVNLGLWNHLYQICCWQKSLSRTGSEMFRTFFLSEIPLLNVRWKSLSVIYKMIELVKTHDVSKLDSLLDRACCDSQQISQLNTVLRNTFTDITFWPLKTHNPLKKILLENFQISSLIAYSLGKFILSVLWYSLLPNVCPSNPRTIRRASKIEKQRKSFFFKRKKRCKGRCSYVPDSREGSF